jgi:hypothetical protein
MAKASLDNDLFKRLRASGMRKRVARAIAEAGNNSPKLVRGTVDELRGLADELESKVRGGTSSKSRSAAAKKGAATRKRASAKRSTAAKKGAATRSRKSGTSSSSRSSSSRSTSSRSSGSSSGSRSSSSSRSRANQQSTVQKVVDKAKVPALAVGAGLAGVAGGIALKGRQQSRNGLLSKLPKPSMPSFSLPKTNGSMIKAVGEAAKGIADGSQKVGQVANQVQTASEALEKNRKK